ncbi:protein phosphatase 2C domain-containing protein [Streptomyces sparsogenes]|uniref:protein phosphatase 2C domain-containing protein n=1 Tax=Streptomyces sparsogenes TaxID=67365 RepID=UPI003405AEB1
MSQQGERRGHEDDWWGELYRRDTDDVGPAPAADSVDDRFDSASRTVAGPRPPPPSPASPPAPGAPWGPPTPHHPTRPSRPDPAPGPAGRGPAGPPPADAFEPGVLPCADAYEWADLGPDTVLDGARCGAATLRAVSSRGESARRRGEPRQDALLTARFGAGPGGLVLVALAGGAPGAVGAHRAAREVCEWIAGAVGRSHARLVDDIRTGNRGALKSGLHRLTDRALGRLRAHAAELGLDPAEYAASPRCLLLPTDPDCRTRVVFGAGDGGLFRLRGGAWQDLEPAAPGPEAEAVGDVPAPAAPFRFRASVARPGDVLLMCGGGLAEPLRARPALAGHLARRWTEAEPPGLAAFLADTRTRVEGYADDRTAAAVWEA